ncbi:MAG: FAD/NAD(P)-binding oxidoreductase [Rhodothermales bacterium]
MKHHQIVIAGGGTAGITVAAHLLTKQPGLDIAIVEPSSKHYYQPIWTLVGGGVFQKEVSERDQADVIPPGATWIQDRIAGFDAEHNTVQLEQAGALTYDYLIVALGIQLDWNKIPGLAESIGKPGTGVCSNYSYQTVGSTWATMQAMKKGTAIFTQPSTPIKCGGAPQKICYLAEDYFQRQGVRDKVDVVFASAADGIFHVPHYVPALNAVIARRHISARYKHDLVEIKPDQKQAVFKRMDTGELVTMGYEMLHVTPPMSAPDVLKTSGLGNEGGWVNVDKGTMQHVAYPNVFSLGDCSSLPTSKTGAAIRKQAPALADNLLAVMHHRTPSHLYDGYTSCPLVTGYGSLILAEFDYDKKPTETFAFDQSKERYSMYALKAYGLPQIYWHGMLKGRA